MTVHDDSDRSHAILALSALVFVGGLGGGLVFPILPILGLQLGISAALIGLILSLNRITRLAMNPLSGLLVDHIGARWPLMVGLGIEALATVAFWIGMQGNHPAAWFLAGRGLWGVGSSLLMVGALTAALMISPLGHRGRATAQVRISLGLGMPGGLVLGGLVTARYSPGTAFLTASAITLLGMLMAWRFAPSGKDERLAGKDEVLDGTIPTRTVLRELLADRRLWGVWLFNFLMFFSVQGVILATLALLVRERGVEFADWGVEGTSGLLMAFMMLASVTLSWIIGRRIDRSGHNTASLLLGVMLLITAYVGLALGTSTFVLAGSLILVGLAMGAINIPLLVLMGRWVNADRYGRAVGIYQLLGDLGGSLGPILGLSIMLHWGGRDLFLGLAILLALGIPLAFWLVRCERADEVPTGSSTR